MTYAEEKTMKKTLIATLTAITFVFASTAYAAGTADRHTAMGVKCESCHVTKDKTVPVRKAACLTCHQSYAKMAERTAKVHPNPHYNHFGDRDCSTCHKGHEKSVLTCDQCHKFDLRTP